MAAKDYFSNQAKAYATFRPVYPAELYDFILSYVRNRNTAWDCATGNGQVAQVLCKHFQKVEATDISEQQIKNAYQADNITYSIAKAEKTTFPDNYFDLITVGQALHWINTDEFYNEVRRTATKDALLAVFGYSLLTFNSPLDDLVKEFYHDIVGPYWDEARRLVEEHYKRIPFPFRQIASPLFHIEVNWKSEHFTGYLTSWSATQAYIKQKGEDPVKAFENRLQKHWGKDETKAAVFPLFLKLGFVK